MDTQIELPPEMVPDSWKEVLSDVKTVWTEAVIAGGSLRDLTLGLSPKDIDVFVNANRFSDGFLPNTWEFGKVFSADSGYEMAFREEVKTVAECMKRGFPYPVQVIELNVPEDYRGTLANFAMSRVDFDVCQIAFDGRRVYQSEASANGLASKTWKLVLCPDEASAVRSMDRADRFRDRHPEVTFDTSLADQFLKTQESLKSLDTE